MIGNLGRGRQHVPHPRRRPEKLERLFPVGRAQTVDRGKGRAFGTFVGALVLAVIRNGLNLLNVSSFWQQVVIGIVIALAVLTDTLRRRSA